MTPEQLDKRKTFDGAHPDTDEVCLCFYCGEILHSEEDDVFWENTSDHACVEMLRTAIAASDARVAELEAQLAAVLKREADSQARHDAKLDELEARVAGMREAAAKAMNSRGIQEQVNYGLGRETQNFYRARDIIRALTDADADAALAARDKRVREEALREVLAIPTRTERLGGQNYTYVRCEEVQALIEETQP